MAIIKLLPSLLLVAAFSCCVISSKVKFFDDLSESHGRIIGGSPAALGQFPHQVSLLHVLGAHFCGGSILNNRWVVSAAHCTESRPTSQVRVRVGSLIRNSGGVLHDVSQIINHPSYNGWNYENDITLIQTTTFIAFNNNVRAIGLACWTVGGNVNAEVSGWGQLSLPGQVALELQFMNTRTITTEDCRARHIDERRGVVFDSNICAFSHFGQGVCFGDSGGGLVVDNSLAGIASWVQPCAVGYPDVYARVSSHCQWISAHTS